MNYSEIHDLLQEAISQNLNTDTLIQRVQSRRNSAQKRYLLNALQKFVEMQFIEDELTKISAEYELGEDNVSLQRRKTTLQQLLTQKIREFHAYTRL